jgi:hypothetical protein
MHILDQWQWHVMDAMADDWESIVQIRPHVVEHCGATTDQQIFDVLRDLRQAGLVRLMDADGYGTDAFPADAHDHWFSMTESGMSLWDSEGHKYRGES